MTDVKIKTGRSGPPAMKPGYKYINPGQEDQMEIHGYERSIVWTVIVWIGIFLTVGLLRLFFYWFPHLMVRSTHSKCSLSIATIVVLKDQYLQWYVSRVRQMVVGGQVENTARPKLERGNSTVSFTKLDENEQSTEAGGMEQIKSIRFFVTKKVKFLWNADGQFFEKASGLADSSSCSFFHRQTGLSAEDQVKKRVIYGVNSIRVHVTPVFELIFKQIISPFYIFQIFSCSLWYADEYYYYASCIVLISTISIMVFIYQTRKMQRALRNTIASSTILTVCRDNGVYEEISSDDLVPGDVIEIPRHGCIMQCDAVLVRGNCIVNESMLTGESVPVTKTPLPNPRESGTEDKPFSMKEHARHVLFCGTKVIQTRYYDNQRVRAIVARTGFTTSKGELVRSILHPKPVDFKFNRDTYIFIGILAAIAGLGFIYTIILMVIDEDEPGEIALRALDLITIAVPPALPAALTVGIVFAQNRLKHSQIYCILPNCINVSGTINTFCFDKTGTLTEDGMNMQGLHLVKDGSFTDEVEDKSIAMLEPEMPVMAAMASCHSLTIIDNELCGDPLDLIMFQATGWDLEEPGQEHSRFDMMVPTVVKPHQLKGQLWNKQEATDTEVGILRQFTFESSLQRMSVITRRITSSHFDLFSKGAPEMIASLCRPETVPSNFHEVLMGYTQHGYRVLALAWRPLPENLKYTKIHRLQREQVEKNLTFLGLLVMENRLKPESTPVIQELIEANIRTVMVTGDNMLTALSVARECKMVGSHEKVILVQAYPPQEKADACLEFVNADNTNIKVKEVVKSVSGSETKISMPGLQYYHFAVEGKSWGVIRQYFPDVFPKLVVRGTVFARMSPEQKAQLVEALQELGYYVGMCGDGANDCGALKTAHAGISLSEAEASVASPFTSKNPNIVCVPTLIRQGRGALVTSIGIFKFMAAYSLTQFVSVCLLYWIGNNLTDFQFLYIDLFLLTTLSMTFGRTEAYHKLSPQPPLINLFGIAPVLSLILHTCIVVGFQVFCYLHVMQQDWFVDYVENEDYDYMSYENMAVYIISNYQYIILGVVFSKGAPYRKHMFTNYWFMANLALCVGISLWINIYPTNGLADFLELKSAPNIPYRLVYIGIAAANFLLSLLLETFIIDSYFVTWKLQESVEKCCKSSTFHYNVLEDEIKDTPHWPPISHSSSLAQVFGRMDSVPTTLNEADQASLSGSLLDSDQGETTDVGITVEVGKQGIINEGLLAEEDSVTAL
ncbi:probable cation-transporting ATPase 13A3 isoform X2 [Mizuhopecten yessoensis]|uniref:probable cation-transporting ATPase 13A3 isoform X2 n=1 Tax=Mizuhopecten yessoensis TaxID=6573 RepID=UPI000B45A792|nr:probable cation-transporting ATPase 13A3 isoform X2 [Mizuhopecten yessoensis]XP_021372873.1 probable cation-transporting ATPase 13A3 isoform X2 [Mizuhopecten yessoensis]XP_021372874.1 probable cation-transporting ATPase 13A3 isoform X2 [Mizuhopecten yessoensis]XP_021372875.1 probable cation-transporting ATPase 13A3 isoform X2 [Mizuhopecten yessoensis]